MIRPLLIAVALSAPVAASAQFVAAPSDSSRVCPDRPAPPGWTVNFNVRDADKVILVQQMYRAQSLRAVAESGDCSCSTRFPSWSDANSYYATNYAALDRDGIRQRTSHYSRTANEYRRRAMPICQSQKNW